MHMSETKEPTYVPGILFIKLVQAQRPLTQIEDTHPTQFGIASVDQILSEFGVTNISKIDEGIYRISLSEDADLHKVKNELLTLKIVEDVEFNYLARTMGL